MTTDKPLWLREAEKAKQHGEAARTRAADERAAWIAKGVEEYNRQHGRGGRQYAAAMLGISVGEVDKALRRARGLRSMSSILDDSDQVLRRLYDLELRRVSPMPAIYWEALRHVMSGTFTDMTWLENPGELLAGEVEDADLPDEIDREKLADVCRTWSPVQALAVLDRLTSGSLDTLPTPEDA